MSKSPQRALMMLAAALALGLTLAGPARAKKPQPPPEPGEPVITYYGNGNIYTADANGEGETVVASGNSASFPEFSADGSKICYVEKVDFADQIVVINADGSDRQVVVTYADVDAYNVADGKASVNDTDWGSRQFSSCTWSPDGQFIAFGAEAYEAFMIGEDVHHQKNSYIYKVDVGNGAITRLTASTLNQVADRTPNWSAFYNKIFYTTNRISTSLDQEIWWIDPDGSSAQPIFVGPDYTTLLHPAMSPDGSMLVVNYDPTSIGDLIVVNITTNALGNPIISSVKDFIGWDNGMSDWHAAFSPDSSQLVYSRSYKERRKYIYELVVRDVSTGSEDIIKTSSRDAIGAPHWSPVLPSP